MNAKYGRAPALADVFLQWKGTDACYDFYCTCNPDVPQHFDGMFGGTFRCGGDREEGAEPRPDARVTYCGATWRLECTLRAWQMEGAS
jgi:hypothetical protein